jgi:hypothetical protein
VRCLTDATLLVFGPRSFRSVIELVPTVSRRLLAQLAGHASSDVLLGLYEVRATFPRGTRV